MQGQGGREGRTHAAAANAARATPSPTLRPVALRAGYASTLSTDTVPGLNYRKQGGEHPLRPDEELPEWLWALATPGKTLNELKRAGEESLTYEEVRGVWCAGEEREGAEGGRGQRAGGRCGDTPCWSWPLASDCAAAAAAAPHHRRCATSSWKTATISGSEMRSSPSSRAPEPRPPYFCCCPPLLLLLPLPPCALMPLQRIQLNSRPSRGVVRRDKGARSRERQEFSGGGKSGTSGRGVRTLLGRQWERGGRSRAGGGWMECWRWLK